MNHILKEDLPITQDIKDISGLEDNANVALIATVSKSTVQPKKSVGEFYLSVALMDKTGTVDMPIWDNAEEMAKEIPVGSIIFVRANKKSYEERVQLTKPTILICEGFEASDFMPKYNIQVADLAKELISYATKITDQRYITFLQKLLGIKISSDFEVLNEKKWTAFSNCPAAAKHHGNKIHGLLLHTIGVLRTIDASVNLHNDFEDIDTEEAIDKNMLYFLAIIHDYCKLFEYNFSTTISAKENLYVSHDVLLIGELQHLNRSNSNLFSTEEMSKMFFIILTHHGEYGRYKPTEKDKFPVEAKLLHCADMIDSQIVGEVEKN